VSVPRRGLLVAGGAALVAAIVASAVLWARPGSGGEPGADPPTGTEVAGCELSEPDELQFEVVRTLPHDPTAYTQGLVVFDDRLFESTGRKGSSMLRELDMATGEVLEQADLAPEEFGEGLTATDDGRLIQLTWLDGVAYEWDPDTLERLGEFSYVGEGWGLTTLEDGRLAMSDGTDVLAVRDPENFSEVDSLVIRRSGGDANRLNELEWDGEVLWANRFQTDELLRIDPECATVTGVADLSELREDATATADASGDGLPIDVTNGIAHLPGTDRYLVTGKWWPTMYEIRIS